MKTLVEATFKQHIYQWDGEVRQQFSGAAMGVKSFWHPSQGCYGQMDANLQVQMQ